MKPYLIYIVGPAIILLSLVILLSGCATPPVVDARPIVNCPQPTAAALSPPVPQTQVPALDGSDPSEVVRVLSEVIVIDAKLFEDEVDRRETLIDHGVRFCGWTR